MLIRIARIQVDPAKLDQYQTLLKAEIEDAVGLEPGVLT